MVCHFREMIPRCVVLYRIVQPVFLQTQKTFLQIGTGQVFMEYLDFRRIKIARHLSLQLCRTLLDRTTDLPSGIKDLAKLQTDRSLSNLSIFSESKVPNIFRRCSVPSRGSYNWFTSGVKDLHAKLQRDRSLSNISIFFVQPV